MTRAVRALWVAGLALAAVPLAVPAQAQTAKPGPEARLVALTDTIVKAVGAGDTVILIYAEFDDSKNRLNFVTSDAVVSTRFAVPGTRLVRKPPDALMPIAKPLHQALFKAVGSRSQRWIEMVIDHGKAAVRTGKLKELPDAPFEVRFDAATHRVFPGYDIEPFTPAG